MSRALRIAVADDEPDVRDYFQRMLPKLGHTVVAAASNGRELVEMCREYQPDLVIADVRMPEMDGDDALRQICKVRPIPFILISAYSKITGADDGFGAAQWTCLTKPVRRDHLESAIERLRPKVGASD